VSSLEDILRQAGACLESGDFAQAEQHCRRALELRPDLAELFARLGVELQGVVAGESGPLQPAVCGIAGPVEVPMAPGELLDKLSILAIKLERISDEQKLLYVRREHQRLESVRRRAVPLGGELTRLAGELKEVNERLWDIENDIRDCEARQDFGPTFIQLARAVYQTNDRRAEIKREIDTLLGSPVLEQKDYTAYA
jgi:hypothetical protein